MTDPDDLLGLLRAAAAVVDQGRRFGLELESRLNGDVRRIDMGPFYDVARALRRAAKDVRQRPCSGDCLESVALMPLSEWAGENGYSERQARRRADEGLIPGARKAGRNCWVVLVRYSGDVGTGPSLHQDHPVRAETFEMSKGNR